jgi:RHS repeat-associated protein
VRDQRHRISEIHRFGGPYRRYLYGVGDTIIEEQDGNGDTLVKHAIFPNGLHRASTLASGEKYLYEYDASGNFTRASSSKHEVRQQHREGHRTLDERDGDGIRHEYTAALLLAETRYFEHFRVSYAYTEDSKLRITTPDGSTHVVWQDQTRVVRENGNGTSEAMSFDAKERLVSRACWRSGNGALGAFWTTGYDYDAAGCLLSCVDGSRAQRYEYDEDQRLVAQHDHRGERRFVYDAAGNLTTTPQHRAVDYGEGNLLQRADFDHFYFDVRRRLAQHERPQGRASEYSYDSFDQLVQVRFRDREQVWRAAYDGLGRRLWRQYGADRTDFYWDGDRLAAERFPDGKLRLYVYVNEDALVPFMWLDYSDPKADPAGGKAFYLFAAPTGMPLRVEDANGDEVWRATAVDAYGELDETGAACPTRLRFAGHFHDEHLNLTYNRFRDYDPALGRYLQPDPLGHAGGINLFAYSANPLVEVDLRGLMHKKQARAAAESGSGGNKRGSEQDGPKLKGVSKSERALAAAPGNTRAQQRARKKVVSAFLSQHGQEYDPNAKRLKKPTPKQVRDQLRGHDTSKPVKVGPPPRAPSPKYQWQRKSGNQGSYYGDADARPTEVGIAGINRGDDGRYVGKQQKAYKIKRNAPYLESTSAPVKDRWSVKGQPVQTSGGKQQWVIPERSDATPL